VFANSNSSNSVALLKHSSLDAWLKSWCCANEPFDWYVLGLGLPGKGNKLMLETSRSTYCKCVASFAFLGDLTDVIYAVFSQAIQSVYVEPKSRMDERLVVLHCFCQRCVGILLSK
jgi:hypothetical protein